jgi:sigma-B regulation protein RsbU (phosphoserine phosphatase)
LRAKLSRQREASRELDDATRAQSYLLRRLPPVPGYALAAGTLAARGVGGDFYAALETEARLAFVLGDVSGKGMAAGLIASSVQARWEAAVAHDHLAVPQMIAALNRDVLASTEGSRYATLVHGVLDPATGELHYVNAGHPSAIVFNAAGIETARLDATASAVGLMEIDDFPAASHRLAPGDTLVVVSDGVTEARDAAGVDWDVSRLAGLVARYRDDTAAAVDAVIAAVRAHRGADQTQDDVTVFILRRLP